MTAPSVAAFIAIALLPSLVTPSDPRPAAALQGAQSAPTALGAKQYLDNAGQTLTGVAEESLPNDARKVFTQLRADFAGLSSAYASSQPPLRGDPAGKATAGTDRPTEDWMTRFYDVERDIALLIGGGGMLPPATAGSILSQEEVPDISLLGQKDPSLASRTALERFRTQLELFYDAADREDSDAAKKRARP